MKTINLKDYYPYYTQDTFVEVPYDVQDTVDHQDKSKLLWQFDETQYSDYADEHFAGKEDFSTRVLHKK